MEIFQLGRVGGRARRVGPGLEIFLPPSPGPKISDMMNFS